MSEEIDVLKEVAARLEAAGIAYMVSGSMAMNYYAQPRMTRDIDMVVELRSGDADRIQAMFGADFYCNIDAVRDAIASRSPFNLIHTALVIKVDMIVRNDSAYRRMEFSRRRAVNVEGMQLWLVAPEDLLLSKLYWAKDSRSELQLNDARNLIACVLDLDWLYMERWTAELGVGDLLNEVRA